MEAPPATTSELLCRMANFEAEHKRKLAQLNTEIDQYMAVNSIALPALMKRKSECEPVLHQVRNKLAAIQEHLPKTQKVLEEAREHLFGSFPKGMVVPNTATNQHIQKKSEEDDLYQLIRKIKNELVGFFTNPISPYRQWLETPIDPLSVQQIPINEDLRQQINEVMKEPKYLHFPLRKELTEQIDLLTRFRSPFKPFVLPTAQFSALFPHSDGLPLMGSCRAFRLYQEHYIEDHFLSSLVCRLFYGTLERFPLQDPFHVMNPEAVIGFSLKVGQRSATLLNLNLFTLVFMVNYCKQAHFSSPLLRYATSELLLRPALLKVDSLIRVILPVKEIMKPFAQYAIQPGNFHALEQLEAILSFAIPCLIESFLNKTPEVQADEAYSLVKIFMRLMQRKKNVAHIALQHSAVFINQTVMKKYEKTKRKVPKLLDIDLIEKQSYDLIGRPDPHFYQNTCNEIKNCRPETLLKRVRAFELPREKENKAKQLVHLFFKNDTPTLAALLPDGKERSRLETVLVQCPAFAVDLNKIQSPSPLVQRLAYLLLNFQDEPTVRKLIFEYAVSYVQNEAADTFLHSKVSYGSYYHQYLNDPDRAAIDALTYSTYKMGSHSQLRRIEQLLAP